MTTYTIHDQRLNRLPEQHAVGSWDEMVAWAREHSMVVGKRRTEWDDDAMRVLGLDGNLTAYAVCSHQGGIRAVLVERA